MLRWMLSGEQACRWPSERLRPYQLDASAHAMRRAGRARCWLETDKKSPRNAHSNIAATRHEWQLSANFWPGTSRRDRSPSRISAHARQDDARRGRLPCPAGREARSGCRSSLRRVLAAQSPFPPAASDPEGDWAALNSCLALSSREWPLSADFWREKTGAARTPSGIRASRHWGDGPKRRA